VKQGYTEASGVSGVSEMMELIQASRAFETNVNMIKYQDEALGRLLQSAASH
jgi:flagellar basal body rod protein FlgG